MEDNAIHLQYQGGNLVFEVPKNIDINNSKVEIPMVFKENGKQTSLISTIPLNKLPYQWVNLSKMYLSKKT